MSSNAYKSDFEEPMQRLTDWWNGKKTDRTIARVTAPIPNSTCLKFINKSPERYTDFDTVFNNLDYTLSTTYYGGEAFPYHRPFGWILFCETLFGSEPEFSDDTIWYHHCHSLDSLAGYCFSLENKWWRFIEKMLNKSKERSNDSYLVSLMSVASAVDMIAGLIGNENTLISMGLYKDKLKKTRDKINSYGKLTYEITENITKSKYGGTIDGFGLWCPERMRISQCDMSVMISTQMFDEFVRPDLEVTFNEVDHGIYHLDGVEQLRHLDILLNMKCIDVIQWVPSTRYGNGDEKDPLSWIDLIKRVQNSGKSMHISCPPERVSALLNKIDKHKVILQIGCKDKEQADDTLRTLDKIGRTR